MNHNSENTENYLQHISPLICLFEAKGYICEETNNGVQTVLVVTRQAKENGPDTACPLATLVKWIGFGLNVEVCDATKDA